MNQQVDPTRRDIFTNSQRGYVSKKLGMPCTGQCVLGYSWLSTCSTACVPAKYHAISRFERWNRDERRGLKTERSWGGNGVPLPLRESRMRSSDKVRKDRRRMDYRGVSKDETIWKQKQKTSLTVSRLPHSPRV
ncbi:uncharacterized protein LOC135162207 [Diachasmimorpha longicaudata]|uniref:uncharacterized protein LOC135162207 n=1 Tax=Diachasmimorpha longicaudata TaxID=58733 RepID=UPI0030B8FE44